jgi:hypothetical protein
MGKMVSTALGMYVSGATRDGLVAVGVERVIGESW